MIDEKFSLGYNPDEWLSNVLSQFTNKKFLLGSDNKIRDEVLSDNVVLWSQLSELDENKDHKISLLDEIIGPAKKNVLAQLLDDNGQLKDDKVNKNVALKSDLNEYTTTKYVGDSVAGAVSGIYSTLLDNPDSQNKKIKADLLDLSGLVNKSELSNVVRTDDLVEYVKHDTLFDKSGTLKVLPNDIVRTAQLANKADIAYVTDALSSYIRKAELFDADGNVLLSKLPELPQYLKEGDIKDSYVRWTDLTDNNSGIKTLKDGFIASSIARVADVVSKIDTAKTNIESALYNTHEDGTRKVKTELLPDFAYRVELNNELAKINTVLNSKITIEAVNKLGNELFDNYDATDKTIKFALIEKYFTPYVKSTDLDAVKSDLATTKSDLGTTKTSLETVKSDLGTTKTNLDAVKSDLNTTKTSLETVKSDLNTTKESLNTVESDLGTTKTSLETVKSDLGATKTELGTTKTSLDAVKSELGTTKTSLDAVKTDLGTTKTNLDAVKTDLNTTKESLNTVESELGATKTGLETVKSDLNTTKESLNTVESELGTVKTSLDTTKESINGIKEVLNTKADTSVVTDLSSSISNINHNIDEELKDYVKVKDLFVTEHISGEGEDEVRRVLLNDKTNKPTIIRDLLGLSDSDTTHPSSDSATTSTGVYKGPGRPDNLGTTNGTLNDVIPKNGDKYISTDGAGTGAWEWVYFNNKWNVSQGDTGWRYVSTVPERMESLYRNYISNTYTNEAYKNLIFDYIKYRRINNIVFYEIGSEDNLNPIYKQEPILNYFISANNRNSLFNFAHFVPHKSTPANVVGKDSILLNYGFRPLSNKKIQVNTNVNSFPNPNSTFVIAANKGDQLVPFVNRETKLAVGEKTVLPVTVIKMPYVLGNYIPYTEEDKNVDMITITEMETSINKVISDDTVNGSSTSNFKILVRNTNDIYYNGDDTVQSSAKTPKTVISCNLVKVITVMTGAKVNKLCVINNTRFSTLAGSYANIPVDLKNKENSTYESLLEASGIKNVTEISFDNNGTKEIINKTDKLDPAYFYVMSGTTENAHNLVATEEIKIVINGKTELEHDYNNLRYKEYKFNGVLTEKKNYVKLLLDISLYLLKFHEKIAAALGIPKVLGFNRALRKKVDDQFDVDLQDKIVIDAYKVVEGEKTYYVPIKQYYVNQMYITNMRYQAQKKQLNLCNLVLDTTGNISFENTVNFATKETAAPPDINTYNFNRQNYHILDNGNWIPLFNLVKWDYEGNGITIPTKLCNKEFIEYITSDDWPTVDALSGIPYEDRTEIGTWKNGIPYEERSI